MFEKEERVHTIKIKDTRFRNKLFGQRIRSVNDFRRVHPGKLDDGRLMRAFGYYKKKPPDWNRIYKTLRITDTVGKDMKDDLVSYFNIFAIHGKFPRERPNGTESYIYRLLSPQAMSIIKYGTIAGFNRQKISEMIGITEGQLSDWSKRFPEVRSALLHGRDLADLNVVKAAYRRATGMGIRDTYFSAYEGEIKTKPFVKYLPPNPHSIELWLKHNKQWLKETSSDGEERGLIMEELDKKINEPVSGDDEVEE